MAMAGREFGGLDILVTGAGLYVEQEVATMTDADWRRTVAVNLDGVFHACRAAMPLLRDGGSIVNIASMAGHRGSVRHAHYAACKAAVLAFTRSLVHELSPRGVRANCVSPGIIATPMTEAVMASNGAALIAATPMRRFGTRGKSPPSSPSSPPMRPPSSPARRSTSMAGFTWIEMVFLALLAVAVLLAVLVRRLPRGGMRALVAGGAVLALVGAALIRLRAGHLPGHGPRRWHNAS